jgi:type VI secretion system secreted protein VgrG
MNAPAHDLLPRVDYEFSCGRSSADWAVRRFRLDEALSRCYRLQIELVTDELDADSDALLGADASLTIDRQMVSRRVSGVVSRVIHAGIIRDRLHISLELVPALELLDLRVDTRLWQHSSVVEVVSEVLTAGLERFGREFRLDGLTAEYPPREYIVQYDESDLAFVTRLLENEGITYWFDHEGVNDREVLVLEDSNDNYVEVSTLDDKPELPLISNRAGHVGAECLQSLSWIREVTSARIFRRTYDWSAPRMQIEASASMPSDNGGAGEVYRHDIVVEAQPDARARRWLVDRTRGDRRSEGQSNVIGLMPGRRFEAVGHQGGGLDREYLLVRVVHEGDCPDVVLAEEQEGPRYRNSFECLPFDASISFQPGISAPPMRISGPQTAIVTGPEGEEIHTDEFGRVKVRFHWDRLHRDTDDSSVWIRVAQQWGGPGFGSFFLPRVGMEVIVEFLHGDPDRPLITGCVYNGDNQPSILLPDHKSQSTIRTRSTPNSDGYNELRFEDASGCEEIFVHAQKNLTEVVRHSHSTRVGANQTNSVGGSQTQAIAGSQGESIGGGQQLMVRGMRTVEIVGDDQSTHRASRRATIEGDARLEVLGNTTLSSGCRLQVDALQDFVQTVGGSSMVVVAAGAAGPGDGSMSCANTYTIDAATAIELSQGGGGASITLACKGIAAVAEGSIQIHAGGDIGALSASTVSVAASTKVMLSNEDATISICSGKISVSSPTEIHLCVGASSIRIDASGIKLSAPLVDIDGALVQISM